ncbi:MAG TPA: IS630 family transposase [Anaerolineaceae bacterium]|nr:IS630 family transposase [Anaerolineaceae bacterium]
MIGQRPAHYGIQQTRWTLAAILQACRWLRIKTLTGVYQLLKRLHIHRKRGRGHLHSPDPNYVGKLRDVWLRLRAVRVDPDKQVLLFSDEFTFYRQPSLSYDYARTGKTQPLAELGYRANLTWRIAGALNAWTGQLLYANHSHFTLKLLVDFYQQVTQAYPQAEIIYLVVDNWPIHFHADVLAALHDPTLPWPLKLPANWPDAPSPKARHLDLPIRLLPLPTYAPWNNPIEKLWHLLKQHVLHLHRFADDWDGLKQRVNQELDQYRQPSPDLLRYVGLQDPLLLYHALFQDG